MRGPAITFGIVLTLTVMTLICSEARFGNADLKRASGTVTSVYNSGSKDAVFKIAGLKCAFYISHALEKDFNLEDLQQKLVGKKVTIMYAARWTPLDPSCNKYITEMAVGEQILYSHNNNR